MTDSDAEEMPTSMYLQQPTKDRFDSLKRQVEAERDENLTNSAVLDMLLDSYDPADVDDQERGRDE